MPLSDKVWNSCRNVIVTDLNKDDGLDTLINNLERHYAKDEKASAYLAYEKFESFQRPTEMNIIDYIYLSDCTTKFNDTKWYFQQVH